MRQSQGFTIIETVLVLSLMSILALIVTPRISITPDSDLQLRKRLISHINQLKWLNMYDPQRSYVLVIEQATQTISLIQQDKGHAHTEVLTTYKPEQIIQLNRMTPSQIKIQFNPYGKLIGQLKACAHDCLSVNEHPICINQEGFIFDC